MGLPLASQISRPFLAYGSSSAHAAIAKDSSKRLTLAVCVVIRFQSLIKDLTALHPSFPMMIGRINMLSLSVPILSSLLASRSKEFLRNLPEESSLDFPIYLRVLKTICKNIEKADEVLTSAYTYSDVVVNIAYCVHYVALIHFGMPIGGFLGFATLALLSLKRFPQLPEWLQRITVACDCAIDPLIVLAGIIILFTSTLNIIDYLIAIERMNTLLSYVINSKTMKQFLPEWVIDSLPSIHIKSAVPSSQELKRFFRSLGPNPEPSLIDSFCEINPTYIWAEQVGNLFPESTNDKTAEMLFQELETKMVENSVKLDEMQTFGLLKIKEAAIFGRVGDLVPVNLPKFQKLIRAIIQSILDDSEFIDKIKELATVGNSCSDGWTRDINYLYNPASKDITWSVHFQLSKLRGEMIKEMIQKSATKSIANAGLGGTLNVHLTRSVESTLWIFFRSYEAELARKLNPPHLLEKALIHYMPNLPFPLCKGQLNSIVKVIYISFKLDPEAIACFPLENINKIFNYFTSSEIAVERIYQSIKPQYIKVDGRIEARREIPWELVRDHLLQLNHFEVKKNWSKFVKTDKCELSFLSRLGVCALLLDLGIISLKQN